MHEFEKRRWIKRKTAQRILFFLASMGRISHTNIFGASGTMNERSAMYTCVHFKRQSQVRVSCASVVGTDMRHEHTGSRAKHLDELLVQEALRIEQPKRCGRVRVAMAREFRIFACKTETRCTNQRTIKCQLIPMRHCVHVHSASSSTPNLCSSRVRSRAGMSESGSPSSSTMRNS